MRRLRAPLRLAVLLVPLLAGPFQPGIVRAQDLRTIDMVLRPAERLFHAMTARDYPAIWELLSSKSKATIVADVAREQARVAAGAISSEEIAREFAQGGEIARAYWTGYLEQFDPDTALTKSRWEIGEIGEKEAEIRITYRDAERPAVLKLYREEGKWKVGLAETFW